MVDNTPFPFEVPRWVALLKGGNFFFFFGQIFSEVYSGFSSDKHPVYGRRIQLATIWMAWNQGGHGYPQKSVSDKE